jgi:hypothetical protein
MHLLAEEPKPVVIDETIKGAVDRYNMSGKVITNLAEIEAVRRVEAKKEVRKSAKISQKSTPTCATSMSDPLSCLESVQTKF